MLQNTEGRVYFWSPTTISKSSQKKKKRTSFCYVYVDGKKKKRAVSFSQKRKLSTKEKNWQLVIGFNCTYFTRKLTYYEFAWMNTVYPVFQHTKKTPLFWTLHFFCLPTASQPCFFAKWGCESRNFPAFPVKLTGFQRCLPPIIRCSL